MTKLFLSAFSLVIISALSAQSLTVCANCSWESDGFNAVWNQYVISDTTAARMKITAVKIAITRDTLSIGYSMHSNNEVNCSDCRLVRYDSKGREEFIFYNSPSAMGGKLLKLQYVYDEQNRPKYILKYIKNPSDEEDTAYHMQEFMLVSYFEKFSVTKAYSPEGTGFSATPRQQPLYTQTKTFDSQGRTVMQKTVYANNPGRNDSIVYSYPSPGVTIRNVFGAKSVAPNNLHPKKELLFTQTEKKENDHIVLSEDSSAIDGTTDRAQFSYNNSRQLSSVNSRGKGAIAGFCGGENGSTTEIRYDKNGLPEVIIFRGRGEYCALAFYYTF